MRQIFLLLSVLILGLSWAVAQDATQGSTSPSRGTDPNNSGQNAAGSAGQKTVTGCLSGSNGSYTLTDKHGKTYQLTGDTAKLSDHVGHEVNITGNSNSAGSAASGGGAAAGASAGAGAEQTMEVSSVKHVSKTCQAGAGSMSH
jgi:Protein of unknown function (DUF5818)